MAGLPSEEIAASLRSMASAVADAAPDIVQQGAEAIAEQLRISAGQNNRSTMRNLDGGATLDVVVDDASGGATATVTGSGSNPGAWAIASEGARPHEISSRMGESLRLSDGMYRRGPVQHPGAPGTGAWEQGLDAGEQPAAEIVEQALDTAFDGGF